MQSEVRAFDYNVLEYYKKLDILIFLLKHTLIIPNFEIIDSDFAMLEKFIHDNKTEKGIITNSKCFMLVAKMYKATSIKIRYDY